MKKKNVLGGLYVSVYKKLLAFLGYDAAILLCELVRRGETTAKGEDLIYPVDEIEKQLYMSKVRQARARRKLVEWECLKAERKGIPPKFIYVIDQKRVKELINIPDKEVYEVWKQAGRDYASTRGFGYPSR